MARTSTETGALTSRYIHAYTYSRGANATLAPRVSDDVLATLDALNPSTS
ncbi:hypothetical protein ACFOEY_20125 [Paracandidimonas soli]